MQTLKKSSIRLSFAETRDELRELEEGEQFQCIVMPHGRACVNNIAADQMPHAKKASRSCSELPTVEQVRDLINCTICDDHSQSDNYYMKIIERQWETEFAKDFFSPRRSPSPYSRNRKRTTSLMACSLDSNVSRKRSFSISSERLVPQVVLTPPPEGIQRSQSAPQGIISSTNVVQQLSRESESEDVFAETDEGVFDLPSPLREQSRLRHDENTSLRTAAVSEDASSVSTSAETTHPTIDRNQSEGMQVSQRGGRKRHVGHSAHGDGFHWGEAYAWAPWKIRDGVVGLLQEPIPGPETKGQLYVVRVNTGGHQRYVKIGQTHRSVNTRLKEVDEQLSQQGITLEMQSIKPTAKLPIMQIVRLEKLVHADLAFFRRDLCIVKGKQTSYATEYFELSQEDAWETVLMWIGIMEKAGMLPGQDLDENVKQGIRSCSDYLEAADGSDEEAEVERWRRINQNHEQRKLVWTSNLPTAVTRKPRSKGGVVSTRSTSNGNSYGKRIPSMSWYAWFVAIVRSCLVKIREAAVALCLLYAAWHALRSSCRDLLNG